MLESAGQSDYAKSPKNNAPKCRKILRQIAEK